MNYVRALSAEYERLFAQTAWVVTAGTGFLGILLAYAINHSAGIYATIRAGAPLSDALLDIIPRVDTELLHLYGSAGLTVAVLLTIFFLPRYFPFALNGLAFLIVVRAIFINMTHLGMYPDAKPFYGSPITFGGDLFFSGHVAIPFFLALVFWKHVYLRVFYIACSVILGGSAIIGHYHYSVDSFAATFIAYGIFVIAQTVFSHAWKFARE